MSRVNKHDDNVGEIIEKGLTNDDDANAEQGLARAPADGVGVLQEVTQVSDAPGLRVPTPRFVARDDEDTVWQDGVHTDRLQRGAVTSFPPEIIEAMKSGFICISCMEPQDTAFPTECSLCGYDMREFQAIAFATQFEGTTNYGPSLTFQAMDEARRMEEEKKAFDKKLADGGSPMKGLR